MEISLNKKHLSLSKKKMKKEKFNNSLSLQNSACHTHNLKQETVREKCKLIFGQSL